MQITHPGHRHYSTEVSLHDSDLPLFLDYCVNVIQRFNHHHYESYQNNLDNIDCIIKIVDLTSSLQDTDDPKIVFDIRADLRKELANFEYLCDTMARCFVSPSFVIDFYHRLSDKLNAEIIAYAGLDYD
jgi:hypothetical protein|tara:strand:- start:239 stop:625 length:387 start_codon:yes stop_codon:yes gene_type:complete